MDKLTPTMRIKLKQMLLNQEKLYNEQGEIEAAKLRKAIPALSSLESDKAKLRVLLAQEKQEHAYKNMRKKAIKKPGR